MDIPSLSSYGRLTVVFTEHSIENKTVYHHFLIESNDKTISIPIIDRFSHMKEFADQIKLLEKQKDGTRC